MNTITTNTDHREALVCSKYDIIMLGGLAGRFDQTIHVVSYMHKCRKRRKHMFVVTNDSVGWCLDEV